jgi:fatty-acyl-CoA synthase/long-chain acyl-CoA synthetase
MTVGDILRYFSKRNPDKVAIYYLDKVITYRDLNIRVNNLANRLVSLGFQRDDKISILLRNCNEYLEIIYALAKIGVVSVPINFRLIGEEIKYIVNDSDSKGLVLEEEFIDKIIPVRSQLSIESDKYYVIGNKAVEGMVQYESLFEDSCSEEPGVNVDENGCFVMSYTSGTTGRPKGVVASHKVRIQDALAQAIEFKIFEDDIHLVAAPLCHSGGMFFCLARLAVGGTVCMMRQFDAEEALKVIEGKRVTNTFMVPTMYNFILELPESTRQKYDVSSMRVLICAGAPLPTRVKEGVIKFFYNAGLIEFYGLTECAVATYLEPCDQLRKIRCAGKPFWGVEIKLLNERREEVSVNETGEIVLKSPYVMDGYYKRGEEGFEGEWFCTGDLARQDEEGYFYIVDRKIDMIISGGENIYPAEIEDLLYSQSKILEAAVIGVPDERWGESVKALIVLKEGEKANEEEIIEFCRTRLGGYKIPRSVNFLEELPKSSSGKILKRVLREEFWRGKQVKV